MLNDLTILLAGYLLKIQQGFHDVTSLAEQVKRDDNYLLNQLFNRFRDLETLSSDEIQIFVEDEFEKLCSKEKSLPLQLTSIAFAIAYDSSYEVGIKDNELLCSLGKNFIRVLEKEEVYEVMFDLPSGIGQANFYEAYSMFKFLKYLVT